MIKDYKILSETDVATLVVSVLAEMEDGYSPIGGVAHDGTNYVQAVGK